MGSEAKCRVRVGRQTSEGKALLETDELVFRGDFRLRIALKSIRRVEADGDTLVLALADGTTAHFELGRVAARWAEKIRSPPLRLDKLGVTTTAHVELVGRFDDDFAAEVGVRARSGGRAPSLIFLAASSRPGLARIGTLRKKLRDDGALWIVYPKGQQDIREADVLAAGRDAGLKDVKVARFSETHTALKFVIPLVERGKKR